MNIYKILFEVSSPWLVKLNGIPGYSMEDSIKVNSIHHYADKTNLHQLDYDFLRNIKQNHYEKNILDVDVNSINDHEISTYLLFIDMDHKEGFGDNIVNIVSTYARSIIRENKLQELLSE